MNVTDTKEKLERLDRLIRLNATGTPRQLAKKLNTTERTVYRIIKQLKEIGCPIYFNKERKSYCYQCKGTMTFKFNQHNPDNKGLKSTGGGVIRKTDLSFLQTDIRCQWPDLVL